MRQRDRKREMREQRRKRVLGRETKEIVMCGDKGGGDVESYMPMIISYYLKDQAVSYCVNHDSRDICKLCL